MYYRHSFEASTFPRNGVQIISLHVNKKVIAYLTRYFIRFM